MKKLYIFLLAILSFSAYSQAITFGSPSLKTRLLQSNSSNNIAKDINGNSIKIDVDNNQLITVDEALNVYEVDLGNVTPIIYNLIGMEHFSNIRWINLSSSRPSDTDLAAMFPNLRELHCAYMGSNVSNINISGLDLKVLICDANSAMIPYLTGSLGMAQFTNLEILSCANNGLTSLDVSSLPNLKELICGSNQLNQLNVGGLSNLEVLNCSNNNLTLLNLSACPSLKEFSMSNNLFTSFDFSGHLNLESILADNCPNLASVTLLNLPSLVTFNAVDSELTNLQLNNLPLLAGINVTGNNLDTLDASGLASLLSIHCTYNNMSTLNVEGCILLDVLDCSNNLLTTLDLSTCTSLSNVNCSYNNLETLFVKNGKYNTDYFLIDNNPALHYICADEFEIDSVLVKVNGNGYNCTVNSYCSFVPGGEVFSINGSQRFDSDSNGCSPSDLVFPHLKYRISSAAAVGFAVSGPSGTYNLQFPAGTHTIKPVFESNYFFSTPNDRTVTFPGTSSNVSQDFCITTFGNYPDVEVLLIPLNAARPGFDANYRIVYRNKGNKVAQGTVLLNFDDARTDLISASPSINNQSGNTLIWNYTNLLPFESREINVVLNLNSPTEIPSLNSSDVLAFQAVITNQLTDVSPDDNTFDFNQNVVNSFDPNDKTCIQGSTIPLVNVGKYVTYIIRFENTGTFAAQNVVVSDIIDSAKFDLTSIVPITASHPFETRIVSPNRLDFIFENIQLQFDDANNDGFVAFKIKTKQTLAIGDTFENSASIYFDYNFPIVTDPAITTVSQNLNSNDFDFNQHFSLYPNPSSSAISLKSNGTQIIRSLSIYNTLGQIILSLSSPNMDEKIDISMLQTGSYIVRVYTEKGTSTVKFIKQ